MGLQVGVLLAAFASPAIPPTNSPLASTCAGTQLTVAAAKLSTAPRDNNPLCDANACINGRTDSSMCPAGCCAVDSDGCLSPKNGVNSAWLRLDLTASVAIGCVGIYLDSTRKNGGRLLRVHEIRVGHDASSPTNNPLCSRFTGETKGLSYVPHRININCAGKYIFVYLPPKTGGKRIIDIAEVEVHAAKQGPTLAPTMQATTAPSVSPSILTLLPTVMPSLGPSTPPVSSPTAGPSIPPSERPTPPPSASPSQATLVSPAVTLAPSSAVYEYVFLHDDANIQFKDYGMTSLTVVAGTADIGGGTASGGAVLRSNSFGSLYGSCLDQEGGGRRYACVAVTPEYAGIRFAYSPTRGRKTIFYVTAADGTADYKIDSYDGANFISTLGTFSATRGSIQRHKYNVRAKALVFSATSGLIYVGVSAADIYGNIGYSADYMVLAPAAPMVYGSVCQDANIVVLGIPSSITESCDDGGSGTIVPDSYIHPVFQAVLSWAGKSCSWKANKIGVGITGTVVRDGGGQDGVSLHPRILFGWKTYLPSTTIIKIISDTPGTCTIGANTVTLTGVTGIYATLSTANYGAGTVLECTMDVMVVADVLTGMLNNVTNDEVNLVMLPMTLVPTTSPTTSPTLVPTTPTASPSVRPTGSSPPSAKPTWRPTASPAASPTTSPTFLPTASPTLQPSETPTGAPTSSPAPPSAAPSSSPTATPTASPTLAPTKSPTSSPSESPTLSDPSVAPSSSPTNAPLAPSVSPTAVTVAPSVSPTAVTVAPSVSPTAVTVAPSVSPTAV
eukprot:Hpha_TRINITY_DN16884_c0_g2::TRINITY_DN16884_c0_g2_i3::g.148380::m.148380